MLSTGFPNGTQEIGIGDVVCLREEPMVPNRWPIAKIIKVHPGQDTKVRAVSVRIAKGD